MLRRAGVLVLGVLLLAPTMGLAGPAAPAPGPAYDSSWGAGFQDALAWSTLHKDKLVAPLVAGAGMNGYAPDVIAAYEEGGLWAAQELARASPALLDARVRSLVARATGDAIAFTRVADVPQPFVAPVSTLVAAQLRTVDRARLVFDPALAPLDAQRVLATEGAFLLGVIDGVLPALHAAAAEAPEEPVFVDPLGLVILGGEGDDTYEPGILPNVEVSPLLVVEPGGDDTYNVPLAAGSSVDNPLPGTVPGDDVGFGAASIALELAGSDVYAQRYAAAGGSRFSVLVDEQGGDSYGSFAIGNSASSRQGFSFLGDRGGDDAYFAKANGLAYAHAGIVPLMGFGTQAAVSVLADWDGDDRYEAATGGEPTGFTHAAAERVGALAVLRDFSGSDTYAANILSVATAEDDAAALFIDDEGSDLVRFALRGGGSMGSRFRGEGGLANAPANRGMGYYLDGDGLDLISATRLCCDPLPVGNDLTRVDSRPDRRWGVFVDCETPPGARFPCEQEQDDVLVEIVTTAV